MLKPTVYAELAEILGESARLNVELAPYAWLGVGGPADLLVMANTVDTIIAAVKLATVAGVPWRVFGGLTNVLLPDTGLRGIVILNRAKNVVWDENHRLLVEAGAVVVPVAIESVRRGLGGLTWAVGLPGTIGGAVVNNAGAFGGEISRTLTQCRILHEDGSSETVDTDWFEFEYRKSKLKTGRDTAVILDCVFQLKARDAAHLQAKADEYTQRRKRTQPPGKTLGSTFKNPPGDYAGRLIEAAGLKGTSVGGMVISDHHANFFINDQQGTAADFMNLITLAQTRVYEQFGVRIEPEIEIVREESLNGR